MEHPEISQSQQHLPRRFLGSLQIQVLAALGFVLFLTLMIVALGYLNLRGMQARAAETLSSATQIRELSLELENEFFLARQNEADFLNQWRALGFELATARYVDANRMHIALAQIKLEQLEQVAEAADADTFAGILTQTADLRPLLEAYQRIFLGVVDNIAERSRPGGLELLLRQQLNQLERQAQELDDPRFLELVLRLQINEYAYLNTKRIEYVDQINLLIRQYQDLVAEPALDLGAVAPTLLEPLEAHLRMFNTLVALDRQIESETTMFRDLTADIRAYTDELVIIGEKGLVQSRAQLAEAEQGSLLTLLLAVGIAVGFGLGSAVYITRRISRPMARLSEAAQQLGQGSLEQRVALTGIAELDALAEAFNAMGARLRTLIGSLERQVGERTHDLEHRASQLRAAIEVGRAIATIRDLDELLAQVTHLISQRFEFYHVGIFLLDASGEYAVLRAANSSGGQEMLRVGHRLAVGAQGIVGYVTAQRETRIALDVGEDAIHFENPYLPQTRSEMALPLLIGDRLLGALDVQSKRAAAFVPADIEVLQGLADQVAIAIENARLFTEAQTALEAEQRAYGSLSREAWLELLRTRTGWGYRYARQSIAAATGEWQPEMREAAQTGQSVLRDGLAAVAGPSLAIPIQERGQVVGVLHFRKSESGETWTPDEVSVLEGLVQQLGIALESARLYEDTQRRAAREQAIRSITDQMQLATDLESLMQITTEELIKILGGSHAYVQMITDAPELAADGD